MWPCVLYTIFYTYTIIDRSNYWISK